MSKYKPTNSCIDRSATSQDGSLAYVMTMNSGMVYVLRGEGGMLVFVTYSIIFTKKIQTSMLGWSDYKTHPTYWGGGVPMSHVDYKKW